MKNKEIAKGRMIYKSCLGSARPDYASIKINEDLMQVNALNELFSSIEGQEYACQVVKECLFGDMRHANKSGAAAIFLFAGPPAVGKTMLAQKIAEALGRPFIRFDMSGYSDKESPQNLFGLHKSYKAAEPGRLTSFIKENPVSVILFDEIEKSHVNVRNNMLQMLDRGSVRDLYYEREFSVRDCILIFTTNVGINAYGASDYYNLSSTPISTVIKALKEELNPITGEPYFSNALVSRFASGNIILFNKLRPEVLHRIVVKQIDEICRYYYEEYDIGSKIDLNDIADMILYSQGGDADVRSLLRATKVFFEKNFERIAVMVSNNGHSGRISGIRYNINLSSASAEVTSILTDYSDSCVLVYGGNIIGGLPKRIKEHVSIVSANTCLSVQDIRKLEPAIAIVGINNKNEAEAKDLFNNLIAVGVTTYVYTKDNNIALTYYAENGANTCFTPRSLISFNDWVRDAVRGIDLSRVTRRLFRANKVVDYLTSYRYSKRTCVVDVTLHDFTTQIAYGGGDGALFAGKAAIPDVKFSDIIGVEEAIRELKPIIRQLKNYKEYKRNGIRIPRGIILDGPPGCGKTSVAKALANATDMPFISLNATEFLSKWVGEGERKIRSIFTTARRYAPSIIFIDEVDCIAKDRMSQAAELSHTEGLTNALLSELDGFNSQNFAPVFVIAATNFDTRSGDSKLDKAFLRRFDKKIHIGLPKVCAREQFVMRELEKYDFCAVSKVAMASIAKRAAGWSLADLNLVIQNAVRHSESDSGFFLTDDILEEAFASFKGGDRKVYDVQSSRKTAYHEAGHAVVAILLGFKPSYVTIVSRGDYGGYMQFAEEDKLDFTREECLNRICVNMAGRAAEVCFYGNEGITTGASGDIRSANDIAVRMVCSYGMESDMFCCIDYNDAMTNEVVFRRIQSILSEQYMRALKLIRNNEDKVDMVAKALFERESLTDNELVNLYFET